MSKKIDRPIIKTNPNLEQPEFGPFLVTTATFFKNDHDQLLGLKLTGNRQEVIEGYLENLQIGFAAYPLNDDFTTLVAEEKGDLLAKKDQTSLRMRRGKQAITSFDDMPRFDDFIIIEVDLVAAEGIEPPFVLEVRIDPEISGTLPHIYRTKQAVDELYTTLTAIDGDMEAFLTETGTRDRFDYASAPEGSEDALYADPPTDMYLDATVMGEGEYNLDLGMLYRVWTRPSNSPI